MFFLLSSVETSPWRFLAKLPDTAPIISSQSHKSRTNVSYQAIKVGRRREKEKMEERPPDHRPSLDFITGEF